ncbi:MAG: hypothetical protein HOV81_20025 [Kofleriaceae bacterium]|nr:hypothetical protein [Kofleriaceae bacterium]
MRLFICVLVGTTSVAYAQHHHGMEHHHAEGEGEAEADRSAFGADVALVAASFETMTYVGNYQGVIPALRWAYARFGVGANVSMYRLEKNGAAVWGAGDAMVHGQVTLVGGEHAQAGIVAGVSAPLGNETSGLSMGHVMLMPAAFGSWTSGRITLAGTAGYGRSLGNMSGHDHGLWPLVEPMNMSEVSWSAGGDYAIVPNVRAGLRASGGIPVLEPGRNRVVGAARVAWRTGPVENAAELQAGLAGDPFTVRGVVSTALSF